MINSMQYGSVTRIHLAYLDTAQCIFLREYSKKSEYTFRYNSHAV